MNRRNLLTSVLTLSSVLMLRPRFASGSETDEFVTRLAALERRHGGRLGVAILDTDSGSRIARRGDERFLMCSTFKLLAVATVLAHIDRGAECLDRRIVFGKEAVLAWAPVTSHHVGAPGMSIAELCQAAITVSDNTAANLLLDSLGGPAAVTQFVRSLGDPVTRLDRIEPELNVGAPNDVRDTTTPNAMLESMRRVLLGHALSDVSRAVLIGWLRACTTGADKLRAGVPHDWSGGDKTGSGSKGETNDVAILWPPQRKPSLVTAYYAGSRADAAGRSAVLADVGRIVGAIGKRRI
ncbi:MAG: class A beta-lactamase [Dokdonella sp.]